MNELKIKELYLIAFLINEGQTPIEMRRVGGVCWFVFEENGKIDELINLYWQNRAVTNVKSYADQIRNLKDRMFAETR